MNFLVYLFPFDSSSDENERIVYKTAWANNIVYMFESQFKEIFRIGKRYFNKLVNFLSRDAIISNLKMRLSVFVFYIIHYSNSTHRKIWELNYLDFRNQKFLELWKKYLVCCVRHR